MTLTENMRAELALELETNAAARQGPAIDVRGYSAVCFALHFAVLPSGLSHMLRIQGSSDGTTWVNLEGQQWAAAPGAADNIGLYDITHPRHRFLRVVVEAGGTGDLTVGAIAYRYNGKRVPVPYVAGMSPFPILTHAPEEAS